MSYKYPMAWLTFRVTTMSYPMAWLTSRVTTMSYPMAWLTSRVTTMSYPMAWLTSTLTPVQHLIHQADGQPAAPTPIPWLLPPPPPSPGSPQQSCRTDHKNLGSSFFPGTGVDWNAVPEDVATGFTLHSFHSRLDRC
ncbi:hypothetical protein ACOMHN_025877 [Nucella lapillus]